MVWLSKRRPIVVDGLRSEYNDVSTFPTRRRFEFHAEEDIYYLVHISAVGYHIEVKVKANTYIHVSYMYWTEMPTLTLENVLHACITCTLDVSEDAILLTFANDT